MMITLGGRPYTISKLEGERAVRWLEALRLFRQEAGYPLSSTVALLAAVYPRFVPCLSELLSNYDRSLPWHEARRNEVLTAFLAITQLNFPNIETGGHT